MIKKAIVLALFLAAAGLSISAQQLKSTGFIIGAGGGHISTDIPSSLNGYTVDKSNSYLNRKAVLELGYRFRFEPSKTNFFYDIDLLGGYSKSDYAIRYETTPDANYGGSDGDRYHLSVGVGATLNYKIVKGLNVGIGVQPMVYLWETSKKIFDAPIVAKVGYNFRFFELAFAYKQGLSKTYRVSDFKGARLSNWQFSVYIPITRRH